MISIFASPAMSQATKTLKKPVLSEASKPEAKSDKTALVDINSASKEELMKIAGIGTSYSDEIIKGRPYKSKKQLVSRNILPDAVFRKVTDKIIAKQK